MNTLLVKILFRSWPFRFGHVRILRALNPAPLPSSEILTKVRGFPLRISYDPNTYIGRYLYFRGIFEEAIFCEIRKQVRNGMRILDCGANIGLHSLVFSYLTGPTGRVVSIEPQKSTRLRLQKNIEINRLKNITVLSCALGAKEDVGYLCHIYEDNDGAATLAPDRNRDAHSGEKVEIKTIDFVQSATGIKVFDIIKIDVEGAELNVLFGLEPMFRDGRKPKVIFVECIDRHLKRFGHDSESLVNWLERHSYEVRCLHRGRWTKIVKKQNLDCDLLARLN